MNLNLEQLHAVRKALGHINSNSDDKFLLVSGPAGTGKTTCLTTIVKNTKARCVICAPTNKAVRVIRQVFHTEPVNPPSCTIYSLLGLTLMPTGEIKQIGGFGRELDFSDFDVVFIDEAFMLNDAVCAYIDEVSEENPRIRWVLLGDGYQLPPVGQSKSPVSDLENTVYLTKVVRTENSILTLCTHIRGLIDKPGPLALSSDNDGSEGVWVHDKEGFKKALDANVEGFADGSCRAGAWRNVTVDKLNAHIRMAIVGPQKDPWLPGERITVLEPVKNFMDDSIIATTDEEAVILEVTETTHPLYRRFKVWHLRVQLESTGAEIVLYSLHEDSLENFSKALKQLAEEAKINRSKWKYYWSFKDSFHKPRLAYSNTTHKLQGSTHQKTFVAYRDVLANPRLSEALRCLYVACSRPKLQLHLG